MRGFRIVSSPHALKSIRLFPVSKHRSKRIHKKLVARYGAAERFEPCGYQLPDGTMILHPTLYEALKK